MTGHLEIEYKFYIDPKVFSRAKFLKLMMSNSDTVEYLFAAGPDFYSSNDKEVIRFRSSKTERFQELTVKTRTSNKSTTVRNEIDLRLCQVDNETVHSFLKLLNFKHEFTLMKQCDIFFMENKAGQKYSVVYYKVWDKKSPSKKYTFIEVEGDKNLPPKQSLKVINTFKKLLEDKQIVNDKQLSKESLYEIFQSKKTK
jgi:adenylate cyclase class IV